MKRTFKMISAMGTAMMLFLISSLTALAADSSLIFRDVDRGFDVQPGSEYHTTDLFDGFKDVMPGDDLTEEITITNEARDCDYIKLYLRMIPHDEQGNPLTTKRAAIKARQAAMRK